MSFFASGWTAATQAAYRIPMSPSTSIAFTTAGSVAAAGKKGSPKRRKPYTPILSSTPARITEPAVGASTCASGSQVWNGKSGTLIANASANPANSHSWARRASSSDTRSS